jgi:hypothetical protein
VRNTPHNFIRGLARTLSDENVLIAYFMVTYPAPKFMPAEAEKIVRVCDWSNQKFLEEHAAPGRIGLSGGVTLIDRAICRAERHLDAEENWGAWSHAFIFQGKRADGHHWVIESDLQIHRKHIQLGVQENRISKYFDEGLYTILAVLDFGLSKPQTDLLISEGLDLVANRARYSLRELLGTLIALRRPELRSRNNVLARERSMYCSAMVRHLFHKIGLDLTPGVDLKNTTPEDIARTPAAHKTYWLERARATSKLKELKGNLKRKLGTKILPAIHAKQAPPAVIRASEQS